ncbi:unnamed protein product, partial [Dibothriocephalus latus]
MLRLFLTARIHPTPSTHIFVSAGVTRFFFQKPFFCLFAFLLLLLFPDALELYKACVAANEDAELNPYFRLFYRHRDSMLMARLCRTVIEDCCVGPDRQS